MAKHIMLLKPLKIVLKYLLTSLILVCFHNYTLNAQDKYSLFDYQTKEIKPSLTNGTSSIEELIIFESSDQDLLTTKLWCKSQPSCKYLIGNKFRILSKKNKLNDLEDNPLIKYIQFENQHPEALGDTNKLNNRIIGAWNNSSPLYDSLSGKDVIIGIIDDGIGINHPDFKWADGSTKVLHYWDHNLQTNENTPSEYGYGQAIDSAAINAGNFFSYTNTEQIYFFHGTQVAGLAAGSGEAHPDVKGVAPNADLIVVRTNFNRVNWKHSIYEAIDFIFKKAKELNKPCVINLSLGSYSGSRDGLDTDALLIDELLDEPGRAIVCAAGNSGAFDPYHNKLKVENDTAFTWYDRNPSTGTINYEAWVDMEDTSTLQLQFSLDSVSNNQYYQTYTSPISKVGNPIDQIQIGYFTHKNGQQIIFYYLYRDAGNGRIRFQLVFQAPPTNHKLRISAIGTGELDAYIITQNGLAKGVTEDNAPTSIDFGDMDKISYTDDETHIVDSWACSPRVITVGNYSNRYSYVSINNDTILTGVTAGSLASTSSKGPSRLGIQKPDISASGDFSFSAVPIPLITARQTFEPFRMLYTNYHHRNGGTSMASPTVAGTVALLLESCPKTPADSIVKWIRETAYSDEHTGNTPNNKTGLVS